MKKILVLAVLAAAVSSGAPRTGWDVQGSGLHDRNPLFSLDTKADRDPAFVATEEMAPITDDLQIADVSDLVEDNSRPTEPTNQPGMHNAGSSKDTFADLSDLVQDNLTESDEIDSTENSRGYTGISDDHQVADLSDLVTDNVTESDELASTENSCGTGVITDVESEGIDDGNRC